MKALTLSILLSLVSFSHVSAQRIEQSLAGDWQTELGICHLPGTTDENKLGSGQHPTNMTTQLTRLYPYTGSLVYTKVVHISREMCHKHLSLYMERTKCSTLWIDGDSIGTINQLYAPHIYELPSLKEGDHIVRIRIDNRDETVPAGVRGSHAWTDATQTNWNGILGKFAIIGTDYAHIKSVNVYPDLKDKSALVRVQVCSDKNTSASLSFSLPSKKSVKTNLNKGTNSIEYRISLGDTLRLWSEFHPYLYKLKVSLSTPMCSDSKEVRFGMHQYGTENTQFSINGFKTFLRGTHDGCVFPLTGYCPTDVESWRKVFRKAKEYGINHYRFHSYTPTEAAFEAADEEGIYLQCELPMWGTIDSTTVELNKFLLNEANTAIEFLGNHPSFMSLGLGNELWGNVRLMHSWLDYFRNKDDRHLYIYGSNNTLGWKGPQNGEDYYVTCRVGGGNHYKTNTRTSFSFADEDDGGILNHVRPNTCNDFSYPVSICSRPIVSHETCQFQMYPDYDQIKKYTGVLYPYNLEVFRDRLKENGLTDQQKDFTRSTVKWALECYKADIEYCVRTKGFGGYQLLDLKDYPGQGSALCGITDAFMDDKLQSSHVKLSMQPVVPLALMDRYCYSNKDTLKVDVAIANYLENDWNGELTCSLICPKQKNKHVNKFDHVIVQQGDVAKVTNISIPLSEYTQATDLTLLIATKDTANHSYYNIYTLWVYPEILSTADVSKSAVYNHKNLILADTLISKTLKALQKGATVILTPSFPSIEKQSIGGLFTPDYWNYAMFKTISENNHRPVSPGSLGMMTNLSDSIKTSFNKYFPNNGATDWQWWCIAKYSRPLILNSLPKTYRPLIQTIDNVERNHKLGILMEFKVGKGKLLISTTDLESISDYVEGRAYKEAIFQYASSDLFNPATELSVDQLHTLLYSETKVKDIQGVKNITDYKNE